MSLIFMALITKLILCIHILSIWCFKRFQHCRTKVHRFNSSECVISLTSFFKLISKIRLEHISDHISYDTFKKKTRNFNQTVIRMWRYYKKRAIDVIIAVLAEISTEQFDECLWPVKTLNELMECSNGAIWVPMESLCIWFPFNSVIGQNMTRVENKRQFSMEKQANSPRLLQIDIISIEK